jgi:hypothetical protein
MELASLEQWTRDHDSADERRFDEINEKFEKLPADIKTTLNGSVEATVNKQMWGFLRWMGVGGVALFFSMAMAWGSLTTQVSQHSEQLKTVLDSKDLNAIQLQLDTQTDSIMELRGDIKTLINKIK